MVPFGPKVLGGSRDLQIVLLSFYECRFNFAGIIDLIALKGGGPTMQTLGTSTYAQAPALAPKPHYKTFTT